jgi:uncharacterized membrane protein
METRPTTWKPMVAGILNVIVGAFYFLGFFGITIAAIVITCTTYWWDYIEPEIYPMSIEVLAGILVAAAVYLLIAGLLSLLGGISALQRKRWGLALAGSIAAVLGSAWVLGIIALIFTAMSKDEFE